jgi:outer membrane protein
MNPYHLVAMLLALLAGPAHAAEDNLLDIYRLAQVEDRQLRAAAAQLEAVREQIPLARAAYLPSLVVGANAYQNYQDPEGSPSDDYASNELNLSLQQAVFDRAAWLRQGQASNRVKQAEVSYTSAEQSLILRTADAYFAVLDGTVNLRAVLADKEAIARQLDQTKQRFEVGLIAITDVHEAQARFDRVVSEEIVARNQLDSAREALRVITGQYHGDVADLAVDVTLARPDPTDIQSWVDQAAAGNLTLLAAQYGVEVARNEIDIQRSGHYPTVDLFASYGDANVGSNNLGLNDRDSGRVGLELNLPLYLGGQVQSLTREAEAGLIQASELYEQQSREVERQTRDAYRSVLASIAAVEALKQTVVSTQSALDATQAGFEVGTRTIVDVLDAQRDLFLAERDYEIARHRYVLSTLSLKQAVGTLDLADVEAANRLLQ